MSINTRDIENIAEIIASAIRSVSCGGVSGPAGLEGVAVAIAGYGLKNPLGESLHEVAGGLHAIAESIDGLTEAIREKK